MKKLVIIGLLLVSTLLVKAQPDTTRIEQYCQIIITPRLFSNKVTIDVDYGEEKKFWQDTRLRTEAGNLKKFNTVIDAMNYMGWAGWVFINAYPLRRGDSNVWHFAFKRSFARNELAASY
ncbi:MAG TPA: hypothetical protein VHK91_17380 [Flavisolibacter sp.]|jgi:hypothetical protein|nr:hypothetical protein [Flavisolibacter sp.]